VKTPLPNLQGAAGIRPEMTNPTTGTYTLQPSCAPDSSADHPLSAFRGYRFQYNFHSHGDHYLEVETHALDNFSVSVGLAAKTIFK
jgi:hypothetical protein